MLCETDWPSERLSEAPRSLHGQVRKRGFMEERIELRG